MELLITHQQTLVFLLMTLIALVILEQMFGGNIENVYNREGKQFKYNKPKKMETQAVEHGCKS